MSQKKQASKASPQTLAQWEAQTGIKAEPLKTIAGYWRVDCTGKGAEFEALYNLTDFRVHRYYAQNNIILAKRA